MTFYHMAESGQFDNNILSNKYLPFSMLGVKIYKIHFYFFQTSVPNDSNEDISSLYFFNFTIKACILTVTEVLLCIFSWCPMRV